jgi:AraC-like DNA-binding protein
MKYHELATPLADIFFREERGRGIWTIAPIAHPRIDAPLYRFLVELQFGIHASLHRDVISPSFAPQELHVTYSPPDIAQTLSDLFECNMLFGQPENKFVFDASWLDSAPNFGNEITYSAILKLCNELMDEFQLRIGLVGKVREILLVNLMRPTSFSGVAEHLHMTTRTLRRKLQEEHTSFRKLVDELRACVAIKYLRDTDLSVEDIASALGFSDAANFRRAFRRWTQSAPYEFRERSKGLLEARASIVPDKNS